MMTKNRVIEEMAARTGVTCVEARNSYDTLWEILLDDFADTGKMSTPVARFYVKDRQARTYTIPIGEDVYVPEGKRIQTRIRKVLRDLLQGLEVPVETE